MIQEAIGAPRDVRAMIVGRTSRTPVLWPSGATRRVSLATLYRWLSIHAKSGLLGLRPPPRKSRGRLRSRLPDEVVKRAISYLTEHEDLGYTMLIAALKSDPELKATLTSYRIPRSTLQRRLAANPQYAQLMRTRRQRRRRCRFVARNPHDIWHLDAKGPITVRTEQGVTLSFHVLTIIDDATRDTLAWTLAPSANLAASVRVLRAAAQRWGLPDRIYIDRASVFDSHAFRAGLAELGVNRIFVKAANPEANGKIEAYHRCLSKWLVKPLEKQVVVDLEHASMLLDGVIESVYRTHIHRGLRMPPRDALGGRVSPRAVSLARLHDAFREERTLKAHPKTGEVDLPGGTYIVPLPLRGKLDFRLDPERKAPPVVIEPGTGRELPLERAAIRPEDAPPKRPIERWGTGLLQQIHDAYNGQVRPTAEPGFGLPEVLALLALASGRPVPRTDAEAALVQRIYRAIGPLARKPTEAAFRAIARDLGKDRPLKTYLDALARRIVPSSAKKQALRRKGGMPL